MINTVIVDMDGTLLTDDKEISSKTVRVIKAFQDRGGNFIINTGRGYGTTKNIIDKAEIKCDCICMSGAAIYNKNEKCIFNDSMSNAEIQLIRELEKKYDLQVNYISDDQSFSETTYEEAKAFYFSEAYVEAKEKGIELSEQEVLKRYSGMLNYIQYSSNVDHLLNADKKIYKVVIMCTDQIINEVKSALEKTKLFVIAQTGRYSYEVNSIRVDKGQATILYAAANDINLSDIMVIGDSENDVKMLTLPVGKSIAMANATEDIKQICTDITLSNNEDGVAYAIEQWT